MYAKWPSTTSPQDLAADILAAASEHRFPKVIALLDDNPGAKLRGFLDMRNEQGFTALMAASHLGQDAAVERLIIAEAGVNVRNKDGDTALMMAAIMGHGSIVKLLIDAGAKVNAQNYDGDTALMRTMVRGEVGIARQLLDAGANPWLGTPNGVVALDQGLLLSPAQKNTLASILVPAMFAPQWWAGRKPKELRHAVESIPPQWRAFGTAATDSLSHNLASPRIHHPHARHSWSPGN